MISILLLKYLKDAKTVIEKMKDIKIKGNKINIEKANKKKNNV